MIYLGIDPGINGAIATTRNQHAAVYRIDGCLVDAVQLLRDIKADADTEGEPIFATLELVNAMPSSDQKGDSTNTGEQKKRVRMGATSAFNFGKTCGILEGALMTLGIPYQKKTPSTWKTKVFNGLHRGLSQKNQKTLARDTARQLYPTLADKFRLVKDSDLAEAILIAHYGRLTCPFTR
jgi:crossover junction endodeoxyribonuclease RuvC